MRLWLGPTAVVTNLSFSFRTTISRSVRAMKRHSAAELQTTGSRGINPRIVWGWNSSFVRQVPGPRSREDHGGNRLWNSEERDFRPASRIRSCESLFPPPQLSLLISIRPLVEAIASRSAPSNRRIRTGSWSARTLRAAVGLCGTCSSQPPRDLTIFRIAPANGGNDYPFRRSMATTFAVVKTNQASSADGGARHTG